MHLIQLTASNALTSFAVHPYEQILHHYTVGTALNGHGSALNGCEFLRCSENILRLV